jgi:protein-tyrosine-phosphatase
MRILFVCTGNTCRSAMAQALAVPLFGAKFTISSAGTHASDGDGASNHAVSVMGEREIDLKAHRSRLVTVELLAEADLVLAMTPQHKAAVAAMHTEVYTLGEYAGCGTAVSDPYGGDLLVYRRCAEEIFGLLTKIKERL